MRTQTELDTSPEEKLLRAIFGEPLGPIHNEVNGVKLRDKIFTLLSDPLFVEREVKVIRMRFGFDDPLGKSQTLDKVKVPFGVTRERIRQIEGKALRKLRDSTRTSQLKPYIQILTEQEICDNWNAQYPIGTKVIFTDYLGKKHKATTGEPAKVVYGKAVVWLNEPTLAARYELDRMQPMRQNVR